MFEKNNSHHTLAKFAGRSPVGTNHAVTQTKDGQFHVRRLGDGSENRIIACGLACSEVVSGRNLADVLRPGFEYERQVLGRLERGLPAPPLSIHTSAGVPAPLASFIRELERHLPWSRADPLAQDWCVSLQMEGASAVMAGVDLLLQLRHVRSGRPAGDIGSWRIGVGAASYHGPPSTSPGARKPLFEAKHNQVTYPVPTPSMTSDELAEYLSSFSRWLDANAADLGCLLVEPQWGSSVCAFLWNPSTLRAVIDMCHSKGVLVLADEIMCGLGRHGQGTMFVSEAWRLDVDAVTFGKAVAAGAYPLSGAILRSGSSELGAVGRTVMQSHTYSGGIVRALMAATEVLRALPALMPSVGVKGQLLETVMRNFADASEGLFSVQGQGLMWGAMLNPAVLEARSGMPSPTAFMALLKEQCEHQGVLPYFVPVGGFMVTPLYDIPDEVLAELGVRLLLALEATLEAVGCVRLFVSQFGNTIPVNMVASESVTTLKNMFRHLKLSFCLTYNGIPLRELDASGSSMTLADYNIRSDSVVAIKVY